MVEYKLIKKGMLGKYQKKAELFRMEWHVSFSYKYSSGDLCEEWHDS